MPSTIEDTESKTRGKADQYANFMKYIQRKCKSQENNRKQIIKSREISEDHHREKDMG